MTTRSTVKASTFQAPRCLAGFTVIELLLALAVLACLAGVAVPIYASYQERGRLAQAVMNIREIETALEGYHSEFGHVPDRYEFLMNPPPTDPWGQAYRYLKLSPMTPSTKSKARKDKNLVPLNSDFDLYSVGKDGDSKAPLTAPPDDVLRANDGGFVGRGDDY